MLKSIDEKFKSSPRNRPTISIGTKHYPTRCGNVLYTAKGMSTPIQLDSSPVQKKVVVHVLPCHIAYDGPAKVSQHFQPRTDPVDETISTSSFRGRKLCGKVIYLPKNYSGSTCFLWDLHRPCFPSDRRSDTIRSNKVWRRG